MGGYDVYEDCSLEILANVPSNFVMVIVNGSAYDLARSLNTLSATWSAPSPKPMVVKQPQFTRVEEPTLLCNHLGTSRTSAVKTHAWQGAPLSMKIADTTPKPSNEAIELRSHVVV